MKLLFRYIFYKVYFFYINVFNEKEIPHWFAGIVLSIILVTNVTLILDSVMYLVCPEIMTSVNIYYKYFALFASLYMIWYVNYKNRYKRIIEACEQLPNQKRKILSYIGVLYVVTVFVAFIWIGELIRAYNMR